MQLEPYVEAIRRDLVTAAEVAGPEARSTAERLTATIEAAVRIALLDVLTEAAAEVTRELAPGSVELRLRAREPQFVVTRPPTSLGTDQPPSPPPTPPPPPSDDGTARLTLRLPESLKARVDLAAAADQISVNTWLVRAIASSVASHGGQHSVHGHPASSGHHGPGQPPTGTSYTGWAR